MRPVRLVTGKVRTDFKFVASFPGKAGRGANAKLGLRRCRSELWSLSCYEPSSEIIWSCIFLANFKSMSFSNRRWHRDCALVRDLLSMTPGLTIGRVRRHCYRTPPPRAGRPPFLEDPHALTGQKVPLLPIDLAFHSSGTLTHITELDC